VPLDPPAGRHGRERTHRQAEPGDRPAKDRPTDADAEGGGDPAPLPRAGGGGQGQPRLALSAPPEQRSGWWCPPGSAMASAGGTASRRSTPWWSGRPGRARGRVAGQGQPGGGRGPASVAVLAGRRRGHPLGGRGGGRRAGAEPQVGDGDHDQDHAQPGPLGPVDQVVAGLVGES
jgi:hypothetical protein